ncbi:GntR family transcriptional regulator [Streptomyces sp. CBMA123]|uniref:GntR family transcriptional regulator n=1 Tax=Streptomyces sp. CBMA123 TaxID=1896313 RepID=UPI00166190BD|nr:GntR family transcriptional regulator [Streptomyces sp. CBMA123]MBD0692977.1 GntR family transcriptional regulator [Streptomyces sp. CBMA123]
MEKPPAHYRQLADDLRAAILDGRHPAGTVLPRITSLATQYGISKQTARQAIALLEAEGLVEVVRRRGTIVRALPQRQKLSRVRQVLRDDRGYYFDPTAQPWVALRKPTITWAPAPHDIASLLRVEPTGDVLLRDRLMGDPDTRKPTQLATSYLPAAIARGTRLAEADTGPGGIYDRLERDLGHGPLAWHETITSRMPTPAEAADLQAPKGTPLLRIIRTSTGPDGTVVEVNDTRMRADEYEIGYPITRHSTAAWPGQRPAGPGL